MKRDKTYWLVWFKAALIRALKTMSQTAVGMLTVGTFMNDVHWAAVFSASLLSGIVSLLMSLAGLPEVNDQTANTKKEDNQNVR